MIYTNTGVPLNEALAQAALAVAERKTYRRPSNYLLNDKGQRAYEIAHDRLGDAYPVFRVMHRHQPGRGFAAREAAKRAS